MRRREFLETVASVVAAGAAAPLFAQTARPKFMLFGLTAVMTDGQGGLSAVLPAVTNHGAFLSGPTALITKLANGKKPKSAPASGIGQGHQDLGKGGTELVCLGQHPVAIGSGAANLQAGLDKYLPNVPQLAAQMQRGTYQFGPYPAGTISIALKGGTLRMPSVPSKNTGTHNVPWQFKHNGNAVGGDYLLTDLLVFESDTPTIDIAIGPSRATLSGGDTLWFVNIPAFNMPDKTVATIEHARDWFSFLNIPVNGTIEAVAKTSFTRPNGIAKLEHPCAGSEPRLSIQAGVTALYFPPDTDPCFIVRA